MPRTVKTIKDNDGNDLEVYADNCNICAAEMTFPKQQADEIDAMFPFLKEKIEAGTPCFECAIKQEKENKKDLFTKEEIEELKRVLMSKE